MKAPKLGLSVSLWASWSQRCRLQPDWRRPQL